MAYVQTNLSLVAKPFGRGPKLFMYLDEAPQSDAEIVAAGFISNGVDMGMAVGDLVDVVQNGTAKYKRYQVTAVDTTTKAVTLAAPTAIT